MNPKSVGRAATAALLAISLVVILGACQGLAEEAAEERAGVDIEQDGESVTITGSEGEEMQYGTASLPEGWPSDVPVYEGVEIQASTSFTLPEGTQLSATMTTSDAYADVAAWYKSAAVEGGWTIESEASFEADGRATSLLGLEKNGAQATINVSDGADGTTTIVTGISLP
jgi:hypothetical protein